MPTYVVENECLPLSKGVQPKPGDAVVKCSHENGERYRYWYITHVVREKKFIIWKIIIQNLSTIALPLDSLSHQLRIGPILCWPAVDRE